VFQKPVGGYGKKTRKNIPIEVANGRRGHKGEMQAYIIFYRMVGSLFLRVVLEGRLDMCFFS
jgi:hypothetical protein